jgi:hypothetical protein
VPPNKSLNIIDGRIFPHWQVGLVALALAFAEQEREVLAGARNPGILRFKSSRGDHSD